MTGIQSTGGIKQVGFNPDTIKSTSPEIYADTLIRSHGGLTRPDYGKIVGQIDALLANTDPAIRIFGQQVEAAVVKQLGGGKPVQMQQAQNALNNAVYYAGGQSWSRNSTAPNPTEMRAGAAKELTQSAVKKDGSSNRVLYDRYMAEDRKFGDGKWKTNDVAKIDAAWKNMIASGAKTPAELKAMERQIVANWGATSNDFKSQFSGANLTLMVDKVYAGLSQLQGVIANDKSGAATAIRKIFENGPEVSNAFGVGLAKGIGGAAGDLLLTLGKTVRFVTDAIPITGLGGELVRYLTPDAVKDWANKNGVGQVFDDITPSFIRGIKTVEAAETAMRNMATYFANRTPGQVATDVSNALSAKWESLKTEYNAMAGDPVRQAEWLGEKVGAILFEVGSSFIPVAGVVGKLGTLAKGADKLADVVDPARVVNKAEDVPPLRPAQIDGRPQFYFDSSGKKGAWNKELNKKLEANADYHVNGYKFSTDVQGRVSSVEGQLTLAKAERNGYQQGVAGRADRLPDDQGGHLIASIFNGPGEAVNLKAMNGNFNMGAFRQMEDKLAEALKAGKEVNVKIDVVHLDGNTRPDAFRVRYQIDGGKPIVKDFENAAGGVK
jgi:DNA/RNA non-specific endonuclease